MTFSHLEMLACRAVFGAIPLPDVIREPEVGVKARISGQQ